VNEKILANRICPNPWPDGEVNESPLREIFYDSYIDFASRATKQVTPDEVRRAFRQRASELYKENNHVDHDRLAKTGVSPHFLRQLQREEPVFSTAEVMNRHYLIQPPPHKWFLRRI
jgi:hypothetical protein